MACAASCQYLSWLPTKQNEGRISANSKPRTQQMSRPHIRACAKISSAQQDWSGGFRCNEIQPKHQRLQQKKTKITAMALPVDLSPGTALTAATLLSVSFAVVRVVVYARLQYITAAMLGRHVPRCGSRVVDLNVSQGRNLYYLPKDVIQVVSVEDGGNRQLLENQAIQAGVPIDVRTAGSDGSWPVLPNSVDAVVSVNGLSKLPAGKLQLALKEAARVLKPGKPLVFIESTVATSGALKSVQLAWWELLRSVGRGDHFTGDLAEAIQASGSFENLQSDRILEFQDPHIVGVAFRNKVAAKSTAEKKSIPASTAGFGGGPKSTRQRK